MPKLTKCMMTIIKLISIVVHSECNNFAEKLLSWVVQFHGMFFSCCQMSRTNCNFWLNSQTLNKMNIYFIHKNVEHSKISQFFSSCDRSFCQSVVACVIYLCIIWHLFTLCYCVFVFVFSLFFFPLSFLVCVSVYSLVSIAQIAMNLGQINILGLSRLD